MRLLPQLKVVRVLLLQQLVRLLQVLLLQQLQLLLLRLLRLLLLLLLSGLLFFTALGSVGLTDRDEGRNADLVAVARLRLAGLLMDAKSYDEALKQLNAEFTPAMAGLAADLRGDVLQAQGQTAQAVTAYQQAWTQLADVADYRRLVQAKLNALGVDPSQVTETKK